MCAPASNSSLLNDARSRRNGSRENQRTRRGLMRPSQPLADLARWQCDSPTPGQALADMIVHAAFSRAARALAANMLDVSRADRTLAGIFKDAGHYVCAMCAIYLNALGDITLPALKALCSE